MKIHIITIGTKLPEWINTGCQDFQKRFTPMADFSLEVKEFPAQKRTKNSNLIDITNKESQALIDAVPKGYLPLALDVGGKRLTSETLATRLRNYRDSSDNIAILIGGPEGFNNQVRQFVRERWSLSDLTFPHPIARLVLIETLYRSVSIVHNHPYHRSGEQS